MCGVRYVNVFVVPCDVYVHCAVLKKKDKNKILKEYPINILKQEIEWVDYFVVQLAKPHLVLVVYANVVCLP